MEKQLKAYIWQDEAYEDSDDCVVVAYSLEEARQLALNDPNVEILPHIIKGEPDRILDCPCVAFSCHRTYFRGDSDDI